ncbi:amino acid/amide ABC transporter membrane protein 2, HAAT family [Marinobacter daqiaonensis]|uniref:Amino acid/amide ABC transporter membrane protein 2, HAAT family n=1 Tax=Marinobacter daqiaonensis TaxID=650891 RepID=A0A1I6J1Q7_9GAMM|nr:branched-chain amino acid ABC transporter permease [Marinobacter daqiaonensis]SFR72944.1 amino acid/amide ABC transporter membrane protein 2, HAAT family [Marinobacter daqiaonensis]
MFERFLNWRMNYVVVLAVIVFAIPLVMENPFYYDMATQIAIIAATVVGLNLLVGYAGQISLGHAGFYGIGAYFSAIATTTYGWPPLLAMIVAAAVVGLVAYIVGRPILKLKGHYLSMATLAVGFIIAIIINNEGQMTGGPDGMPVAPFSLFGWELSSFGLYSFFGMAVPGHVAWYLVMAVILLIAVILAQNIIDSPLGRALRSIHGSEIAARTVGVDTARYKSLVFVISAIYASVMGSIFAHFSGFITPAIASFDYSIVLITMVVLGGMASPMGVILGAVALKLLPQFLAGFQEYETAVFGFILMATMIFMPKGFYPTAVNFVRGKLRKSGGEA